MLAAGAGARTTAGGGGAAAAAGGGVVGVAVGKERKKTMIIMKQKKMPKIRLKGCGVSLITLLVVLAANCPPSPRSSKVPLLRACVRLCRDSTKRLSISGIVNHSISFKASVTFFHGSAVSAKDAGDDGASPAHVPS